MSTGRREQATLPYSCNGALPRRRGDQTTPTGPLILWLRNSRAYSRLTFGPPIQFVAKSLSGIRYFLGPVWVASFECQYVYKWYCISPGCANDGDAQTPQQPRILSFEQLHSELLCLQILSESSENFSEAVAVLDLFELRIWSQTV